VIICTIEKCNQLINQLVEISIKRGDEVEDEELIGIESISTVIVDELHMIGEDQRGYLLEVMLSKLIYL
jgi:replicative superfamily II helicase